MQKNHIAVIGLAVMGANLARNLASHHQRVAVYNRTPTVTTTFSETHKSPNIVPYFDLRELVESLESPRKIIIMVKSGSPVDAVIDELVPLLENDDIIIDCGNSHYMDTLRREKHLNSIGIRYVGCGVSGGEEGALYGPSLMPGCSREAYDEIKPLFSQIAAKDFSGNPCITHIAADGSGHFVKMVHNGIEYAIMQMIAEVYDVFRKGYHFAPGEIAEVFRSYNSGILQSYLIEITAEILAKKDTETDGYLIDQILDTAGAKGTGLWTSQSGLESSVSISSIVEATFARMISSDRIHRLKLSELYDLGSAELVDIKDMIVLLESTLFVGIILAYVQGISLIQKQAKIHAWDIDLAEITRIWQGGCIIRSQVLVLLTQALSGSSLDISLLEIPAIQTIITERSSPYQKTLSLIVGTTIPIPSLSSAWQYFLQMTQENSSANMIQGMRDYFGAHTYERKDRSGVFHTEW